MVITKVLGPVSACVPDSLHSVSDAVTVISEGALVLESADLVSLAVQAAMETPARIAAAAAVPVLMPRVSVT